MPPTPTRSCRDPLGCIPECSGLFYQVGRDAEQGVEQGRERLAAGLWVLVFPKGTRMPPRTYRKYKLGGAMLASATGYPVVPVAHNAGTYWPRCGFLKYAGEIRVVIGPVIESQGCSAEEINRLAEEWIESMMEELEKQ